MHKLFLPALTVCAIFGFDAYILVQYLAAQEEPEVQIAAESADDAVDDNRLDEGTVFVDEQLARGGEFFRPLRVAYDVQGIDNPHWLTVAEAALHDTAYVVGVEVKGDAFAFCMNTMDIETSHIVNFMHQHTPITVTFCPLANCVRVLTRDESELIPLRLGGLNDESTMVVMLDGERFDQDSLGLPLLDYAHTRTTFGKWKRQFPHTKVFTRQSIPVRTRGI